MTEDIYFRLKPIHMIREVKVTADKVAPTEAIYVSHSIRRQADLSKLTGIYTDFET